ncbi:RNA recognition motif domain-containing protein [Streptomyces sp. NPDC090023]|uniref:RNA recognition motif domain-containing protein n=1 Tax=unclassified Streptomyces TaxID=2593676 RepID=UPI003811F8DC
MISTASSRALCAAVLAAAAVTGATASAAAHQVPASAAPEQFPAPTASKSQAKSSTLYVGGLSLTVTKETLEAAFAQYGPIRQIFMPTDRTTGLRRGFAFVTMSTPEAAQEAIDGLNGTVIDGQAITVNEAQRRQAT